MENYVKNDFGMKKTEEIFAVYKMGSLVFLFGTLMGVDYEKKELPNKAMEFLSKIQNFMFQEDSDFASIHNEFLEFNILFSEWCHERGKDLDFQLQNFQAIIDGLYKNETSPEIDISSFMNMKNVISNKDCRRN